MCQRDCLYVRVVSVCESEFGGLAENMVMAAGGSAVTLSRLILQHIPGEGTPLTAGGLAGGQASIETPTIPFRTHMYRGNNTGACYGHRNGMVWQGFVTRPCIGAVWCTFTRGRRFSWATCGLLTADHRHRR